MKRLFLILATTLVSLAPHATHAATPPALLHWTAPMSGMNSYTYWYDPNGGRYSFLSNAAVMSWYPDAKTRAIETPIAELAKIPLKGTMAHKPAARLVKFESSPRIYAVSRFGMLRWLTTENVTTALYGEGWKTNLDELSVADYPVYKFASAVTDSAEFDRDHYFELTPTPSQNIPTAKIPDTYEARALLQTDKTSALVGQTITLTTTISNPQTSWQSLTIRFYDPAGQVMKVCKGTVGCTHSFEATGPLGVQIYTARVFNEYDQAVSSNPVSVVVANPQ